MSIKVRYKDVAMGADKNATVTTTTKTAFSDATQLPFGIDSPALATCELNGWGLSPDYVVRDAEKVAFWSNELSNEMCDFDFSAVPSIDINFGNHYTTTGLTIQFDIESGDYCRGGMVTWYRNTAVLAQEYIFPDSPFFVINKTVEGFNKIHVEFGNTNLPFKRCKVTYIGIGVVREFGLKELKSVKAIHEIDPISSTVPVNVLDVAVHSRDEVDYIFQKKQPVAAYDANKLIGIYYIDKGERTGRLDISFSCKDAIGLFDLEQYEGGLWLNDTPLTTILTAIFGDISVFEIDSAYDNSMLKGYIQAMKKREALQNIAFALGAVVDTSGSEFIKIYPLPYNVPIDILPQKTYIGGKVTTSDVVTAVNVLAFDFEDERPGSGDKSVEFNGEKYKFTERVITAYNPDTVESDPVNVKTFDKCYLVNSGNAQQIADNVMQYYRKRKKYGFKHVMNAEEVGHQYSAQLPWGGTPNGIITKMTVTTSNITVSDTEMVLND